MILIRNKHFSLNDGFGGKKGQIIRSTIKLDSYKKFGPWKVELSENAYDNYQEFDMDGQKKIDKMLAELRTKPFQGSFGQHPLWNFKDKVDECVVWSAEINDKDRLNYLIFKSQNYILVTNLIGHEVINLGYAVRPKN
jgi:Txe/YoeB family toxin of Txe-Axe toxin-antitoxin module